MLLIMADTCRWWLGFVSNGGRYIYKPVHGKIEIPGNLVHWSQVRVQVQVWEGGEKGGREGWKAERASTTTTTRGMW